MEVFTMVVLIVLIACGTGVLNQHFKTRRKELEHSSPNDDVYDEVEMLRERIEVLEKIVEYGKRFPGDVPGLHERYRKFLSDFPDTDTPEYEAAVERLKNVSW